MMNCAVTKEDLREHGANMCPICDRIALLHDSDAIKVERIRISAEAELKREEMTINAQTAIKKEEIRADVELQLAKLQLNERLSIQAGENLSTSIPLYDWKTLQKEIISYQANTDFARFRHAIQVAFSLHSDFRIYSLPPNAMINGKIRVDSVSFRRVLEPFVNISSGESLPTLYVFDSDESPTKLPETISKPLSQYSRSSDSQGSLREMVISRDKMCIFCGDTLSTLAAAHILDLHRATPELIKSLGIIGVNDYRNAISLCQLCHRFYDGHMLCVHPESLSLIVCEAFLSCSPHREKYKPLNGNRVHISEETILMNHCPNDLVLKDRYECFLAKSTERRERNALFSFYCSECNTRWKTQRGMTRHTCKRDHNCTTSSHSVGNYETLSKVTTPDTCEVTNIEDDPGVRDVIDENEFIDSYY